jgi:hypothetical protein
MSAVIPVRGVSENQREQVSTFFMKNNGRCAVSHAIVGRTNGSFSISIY